VGEEINQKLTFLLRTAAKSLTISELPDFGCGLWTSGKSRASQVRVSSGDGHK